MEFQITYNNIRNGQFFTPSSFLIGDFVFLKPGEKVKLTKVIFNDSECSYTYKIQTETGDVGYVLKPEVSITSVLGVKGAILDIHRYGAYEFEGDIPSMDKFIDRYLNFVSVYPESKYVSEALFEGIKLDYHALEPYLKGSQKEMRIDRIYNNLQNLNIPADKPECRQAKDRLLQFFKGNARHLLHGRKYEDFSDILLQTKHVIGNCFPTTIIRNIKHQLN